MPQPDQVILPQRGHIAGLHIRVSSEGVVVVVNVPSAYTPGGIRLNPRPRAGPQSGSRPSPYVAVTSVTTMR